MSKSGELIEALASAGTVDSEGEFTLDRAKARDKLRKFQLADPHRYVLMLVEAAIAQGATRLDFRIDADDVELRFVAPPFAERTLAHLFDALLVDRDRQSPDAFARRQLGFALNAAMGLDPKFAIVESGAWRLEQAPGRDDRLVELSPPAETIRIHVKDRPRWRVVANWWRHRSNKIPEEVRLRANCQHSDVPIYINDALISSGFPERIGLFDVPFDGDHGRGRIGISPQPVSWEAVQVYNRGVGVCEQRINDTPGGLVAIVDGRAFSRDVSQNDVVRDAEYEGAMAALSEARLRTLGQFGLALAQEASANASKLPPPTTPELAALERASSLVPHWSPDYLERFVRGWIAALINTDAGGETTVEDDAADADEKRAKQRRRALFDPEHPAHGLTRVPLWPTVDGKKVDSVTLYADAKRPVRFVHKDFGGYFPEGAERTVVAPEGRDALVEVFGKRVTDATRTFERNEKRWKNKRMWEASKRPAKLDDQEWLARVSLSEPLIGEVGLTQRWRGELSERTVSVLYDGGVIHRFDPVIFLAPDFHAIVQGEFTPLKAFDGVHKDSAYADAIEAVFLASFRAFAQALINRPSRSPSFAPTAFLLIGNEERARTFFLAAGFSAKTATRHARALVWPQLDPTAEDAHPLVDVPLIPLVDDPELRSIRELSKLAEGGPVYAVQAQGSSAVASGPSPRPMAHCSSREQPWLERAFGERLRDGKNMLEQWRARERFLARPPDPAPERHVEGRAWARRLALADRTVWAGVDLEPIRGWWGGDRFGTVFVSVENRPVARLVLDDSLVPGLVLVMDVSHQWVGPEWDALHAEGERQVKAVAREAASKLVQEVFAETKSRSPELDGLARAWVAAWGFGVLDREETIGERVVFRGLGGARVTLASVSVGLREHGYVAFAEDDAQLIPGDAAQVPVPVLARGSRDLEFIERLDGVELVDVTDTLHAELARRRLLSRSPADAVRVKGDEYLVRLPVVAREGSPFSGEVALPPPNTLRNAHMDAFTERRRVESVQCRDKLPWTAAIDGPFTLLGTSDVAEDERLEAAEAAVRHALGQGVDAILEAHDALDGQMLRAHETDWRAVASWWLLRIVADPRIELDEAARSRLWEAAIIPMVDGGGTSLDALAAEEDELEFIPPHVRIAGDDEPVVVSSYTEAQDLGNLVGRPIRDASSRLRALRRVKTLVPVTSLVPEPHPPEDAFVTHEKVGDGWPDSPAGWRIRVWITADSVMPLFLPVGWRGGTVDRVTLPNPLRAAGVVEVGWGSVAETGDALSRPEWMGKRVRVAVAELYRRFGARFVPGTEAGHEMLQAYARSFAQEIQRVQPGDLSGTELAGLKKLFVGLPLFPAANGTMISLEGMVRELEAARAAAQAKRNPRTRRKRQDPVSDTDAPPRPVSNETPPGPEPEELDLETLDPESIDDAMDYAPIDPDAEPPEPKIPPEEVMLRAVVEEIASVAGGNLDVVTSDRLSIVTVEEGKGKRPVSIDGDRVIIDAAHPIAKAATGVDADPCAVSLLASAVFSCVNAVFDEVDEGHETAFCVRHTAWLANHWLAEA